MSQAAPDEYGLAGPDLRILRLVALGWSDAQIADRVSYPGSIASRLSQIRSLTGTKTRPAMALYYVENCLRTDVTTLEAEGEMLERWRTRAVERLAPLREHDRITPLHIEAFSLFVSPAYRNESYAQLGLAMAAPVTGPRFGKFIIGIANFVHPRFGDEPGPWMATVWRLAGDEHPPL